MTGRVNLRELIADILLEIEEGEASNEVLTQKLSKYQFLPRQDRAFITRVVEGTLEYQIQLDYIINQYSTIEVSKMKPPIRVILRSGVYQLKYMDRVPDSAVVNEAVSLAQKRGFYNLRGFVNGVLRNIARNLDHITYPPRSDLAEHLSVCYSMPRMLTDRWLEEYGVEVTEKMLRAFLKESPTTIHCRENGGSRQAILDSLTRQGVVVTKGPYLDNAYQISNYNHILMLEAFREGNILVQDVSSMLVGEIAAPVKKDYIIDLCAAPGGKTIYIADRLKGFGLVDARDISESRAEEIREQVRRWDMINVTVKVQDARLFDEQSEGIANIVLADVPCSGYGAIGRKPEIKYRSSETKEDELILLQRKILDQAVKYVKPGGKLIYSTCTISRRENQGNLRWLLENYPLKCENLDPWIPKELRSETTRRGYLQLLPGVHQCDGFFIARLRKKGLKSDAAV